MNKHVVGVLALILSFAGAQRVYAVEKEIECPTEISESSIRLVGTPRGWTPYVASPIYLSSAGATAGPPEMRATLMGDSTWKKDATEWSTTFEMDDPGFKAGKWMECRYGEHEQLSLSKRLDSKTKACTVYFGQGEKAGQHTIRITCR
jgi:hypothetical protein